MYSQFCICSSEEELKRKLLYLIVQTEFEKTGKDEHNFAHIKDVPPVHSLFQPPANTSQAPKSTRLILFPPTGGE